MQFRELPGYMITWIRKSSICSSKNHIDSMIS